MGFFIFNVHPLANPRSCEPRSDKRGKQFHPLANCLPYLLRHTRTAYGLEVGAGATLRQFFCVETCRFTHCGFLPRFAVGYARTSPTAEVFQNPRQTSFTWVAYPLLCLNVLPSTNPRFHEPGFDRRVKRANALDRVIASSIFLCGFLPRLTSVMRFKPDEETLPLLGPF